MLPVYLLFASSISWGLTWLPIKAFADAGLGGLALSLLAFGAGALALLPWLWRERVAWRGQRRAMAGIMLLGGFANLAFAAAMLHGEVVRVMVLFYLLPAWSTLGGHWLLGERAGLSGWLCVGLAAVGACLSLGGTSLWQGAFGWVDLLAIAAGLSFAANNLVFRACPSLPLASATAAMFSGCALLAALGLAVGLQPASRIGGDTALLAALFGLGWLLLASLVTQWCVMRLEARRAALIIIVELVTSVLSASWLGGDRLQPLEWAGAGLILLAALLEAARGGAVREAQT